jgi:hypothetical protein
MTTILLVVCLLWLSGLTAWMAVQGSPTTATRVEQAAAETPPAPPDLKDVMRAHLAHRLDERATKVGRERLRARLAAREARAARRRDGSA